MHMTNPPGKEIHSIDNAPYGCDRLPEGFLKQLHPCTPKWTKAAAVLGEVSTAPFLAKAHLSNIVIPLNRS